MSAHRRIARIPVLSSSKANASEKLNALQVGFLHITDADAAHSLNFEFTFTDTMVSSQDKHQGSLLWQKRPGCQENPTDVCLVNDLALPEDSSIVSWVSQQGRD